MKLSSEKSALIRQIQSWESFADSQLETEKQKKEFKDILNEYSKYAMVIITSQSDRFPSKPLVTALLSSQNKRIMRWMVDNTK
jgi:predicted Rossmann fold nucleotide-binding protein DprA/Smf involved in DNA uptake